MKKIDFELDPGSTDPEEVRTILEQAIGKHFGDGLLRHQWEGDVLRLSGPGAKGSIGQRSGRWVLEARLRPPASLIHRSIRRKVEAAFADVSAQIAPKEG